MIYLSNYMPAENTEPKALATPNNKGVVVTQTKVEGFRKIFKHLTGPLDTNLIEEYIRLSGLENKTKQQKEREKEILTSVQTLYGYSNGAWLMNIETDIDKAYGLKTMRQDLIAEYDCKSTSEQMLVDQIVSGYWRTIDHERLISRIIQKNGAGTYSFNDHSVRVIKELHRGIEKAHLQVTSSLMLLKELKQPRLNVKVNAETAYIAQNQQVNNPSEQSKPTVEIISDKWFRKNFDYG